MTGWELCRMEQQGCTRGWTEIDKEQVRAGHTPQMCSIILKHIAYSNSYYFTTHELGNKPFCPLWAYATFLMEYCTKQSLSIQLPAGRHTNVQHYSQTHTFISHILIHIILHCTSWEIKPRSPLWTHCLPYEILYQTKSLNSATCRYTHKCAALFSNTHINVVYSNTDYFTMHELGNKLLSPLWAYTAFLIKYCTERNLELPIQLPACRHTIYTRNSLYFSHVNTCPESRTILYVPSEVAPW